jgi:hypothetical protein
MAVVIFKSKQSEKKSKKEYIDLSIQHQNLKKNQTKYKQGFIISVVINVILILYIICV